MTDYSDVINAREAARILGLTKSTLQRRIAAGVVPCRKLPGRLGQFVFDRAEIEHLAAEKATR
ncbi:helix-turn-helix domain-containing protein [Rhodococcus sp. SORGH_AS_0303]|uniref:helix-turn-helix domain-containing protein n=1 Tax=Rhodococcus sp. SORGH_AS_0303 TaxID=3041753 RepID=UPI0027880A5A|nr:helix-turn-helix domain-containing protein [Rhodococcus sp. SORGH_AS_0303]MDQ1202825.1 putative DNA-binding transcriptional regulator AlpA [Rhodococcus sp. SORGH_AS_0303]